jgi:1,4-dihydroxy-6-naphthoate synthase
VKLSLAFSPCPNDCFMFDAIANRRIDLEGLEFAIHLADVESLNDAALAGQAQVSKLSYHAYAYCADRYALLDAGSALGRNCGPLLIANRAISPREVAAGGSPFRVGTRRRISCSASPSRRRTTRPSWCSRTSRARFCATSSTPA